MTPFWRTVFAWRAWRAWCCAIATLCGLEGAHAAPPGSAVYAAASASHVWWVGELAATEHNPRAWVLFHRALLDPEPTLRRAWVFSRAPEAIAASGREVWIAFGSEGNRTREVFQLAVERMPSSAQWINASVAPSPRPPLPSGGVLRGLALTAEGAFACWSPALRDAPRILRCDGVRWNEEAFAEESAGGREFSLADGVGLLDQAPDGSLILAQMRRVRENADRGGRDTLVVAQRTSIHAPGGDSVQWTARAFPLLSREEPSRLVNPRLGSTVVEGRLVLAVGEGLDGVECFDVRGEALLPWTTIDLSNVAFESRAPSSFFLVGMQSGARIFALQDTPEGKALAAQVASVDVSRGVIGPFTPLAERSPGAGQWIFSLFGLGAALLLAVTFFMRGARTEGSRAAQSPQLVASFGQRVLALALDLLPGIVVASFVFDLELREVGALFVAPSFAIDLASIVPSCVMIGASGGLAMLVETMTGASLGKWALGICVVGEDGAPSTRARRAARGLLTVVVVLAPVLALATLSHPRLRGVPELLTRTEVVRRKRAPARVPPGDRLD